MNDKQYKFCCEMLLGGVPFDKEWVMNNPYFKNNYQKILDKYPLLDETFKNNL